MPGGEAHGRIAKRIAFAIAPYEEAGAGEVFIETAFVLEASPGWVKGARIPDVMFYRAERMAAYEEAHPASDNQPLLIVPDIAVEIISPTDLYGDVDEKAHRYLSDGVQAVWVVNPRHKTVTIYEQGSNQLTRLTENDTLSGGGIIEGLAIKVETLFT